MKTLTFFAMALVVNLFSNTADAQNNEQRLVKRTFEMRVYKKMAGGGLGVSAISRGHLVWGEANGHFICQLAFVGKKAQRTLDCTVLKTKKGKVYFEITKEETEGLFSHVLKASALEDLAPLRISYLSRKDVLKKAIPVMIGYGAVAAVAPVLAAPGFVALLGDAYPLYTLASMAPLAAVAHQLDPQYESLTVLEAGQNSWVNFTFYR